MSVIPHLHQRLSSCLLGLLLSGAALAQDPVNLEQAESLLNQGKGKEALQLL